MAPLKSPWGFPLSESSRRAWEERGQLTGLPHGEQHPFPTLMPSLALASSFPLPFVLAAGLSCSYEYPPSSASFPEPTFFLQALGPALSEPPHEISSPQKPNLM